MRDSSGAESPAGEVPHTIAARLVGLRCGDFHAEVGKRAAMNYAAAIGDDSDCFLDDRRGETLAVHPLFACTLTSRHAADVGGRILLESGLPPEAFARQFHYAETLEITRGLRIGERLHIEVTLAALRPHPRGTQLIVRYEARDADRQPVFREHLSTLARGVFCDAAQGAELAGVPAPKSIETSSAMTQWRHERLISRLDSYRYEAGSGLVYPLHTSRQFAESAGLPDIILHGTATLAIAVSALMHNEADCLPAGVRLIACRFAGTVSPADRIGVELMSVARRPSMGATYHLRVLGGAGRAVIRDLEVIAATASSA